MRLAARTLLLTAAFVLAAISRNSRPCTVAKILLAAGVGPLGFGLLRVFMGGVYSEGQVWFGFWEEMTELLLLAGICVTLWTFRGQLLPAWAQLRAQDHIATQVHASWLGGSLPRMCSGNAARKLPLTPPLPARRPAMSAEGIGTCSRSWPRGSTADRRRAPC